MELAYQRRPHELPVRPRSEVRRDVTLDERHDLSCLLVDTEYPRGSVEPYLLQVAQKRVDKGRVRTRGPPHSVAHTDDPLG
jgi:hypothetical protein